MGVNVVVTIGDVLTGGVETIEDFEVTNHSLILHKTFIFSYQTFIPKSTHKPWE